MGWDITAWVEVRPHWAEPDKPAVEWEAIMDASVLVGRNYDAFGCLFGVTNDAHFEPIAGGRDLPTNLSTHVAELAMACLAEESDADFESPSWVTWAEQERVDWDDLALQPDQRLHQYVRDESGAWVFETKSSWSGEFGRAVGLNIKDALRADAPPWPDGKEWIIGDRLYRAERLRRRDAMDDSWWSLFAIMRELAKRFMPEGVRLVVWFDS